VTILVLSLKFKNLSKKCLNLSNAGKAMLYITVLSDMNMRSESLIMIYFRNRDGKKSKFLNPLSIISDSYSSRIVKKLTFTCPSYLNFRKIILDGKISV
jgi:hypothetical protein